MCKLCKTKPVYEFINGRKICKVCFLRYFHKKVLYTIRKFGMVKKNEVISYGAGKDVRDIVLEDVLKMFAEKAFVSLKKNSKRANKKAISDTTDDISKEVVSHVLKNDFGRLKIRPIEGNLIRPLFLFSDKEIILYAKLRGLKFKKVKKEKNFLDDLEIKHPEIKRAIVSSYLALK